MIICPICNMEVNNILAHIKVHDYTIKNKLDFLEKFPTWDQPFQIDTRIRSEHICEFCGKIYKLKNALQLHIKNIHPDKFNKRTFPEGKLICPICQKKINDLRQHVKRTHSLLWEHFCSLYNWDIKNANIVTDEHREKLSKNKIIFYESDRGKILRNEQSIKFSENNPILNPKIKEKVFYTRAINGNNNSYGNRGIFCFYNGYRFRSLIELKIAVLLELNNFKYIYEPSNVCVKYFSIKKQFISTYTPDFIINDNFVVEIKSDREFEMIKTFSDETDWEKYKTIVNIYTNININFMLCTVKCLCSQLNITYNDKVLEGFIIDGWKNDKITFLCNENSATIKRFTRSQDLSITKGVQLRCNSKK